MEVAGANRRWRGQFRYRGSRRESAVAQLFSLGSITIMWHIIITALGISYSVFIFWMLFDCVKYVEDRDERAIEALFIALFGVLFAPIYYFQKYLPRRRERLEKSNHDA